MDTKVCTKCGESRPISNFKSVSWKSKDGVKRARSKVCRKCIRADRRSRGLCSDCKESVTPGHRYCDKCLRKRKPEQLAMMKLLRAIKSGKVDISGLLKKL